MTAATPADVQGAVVVRLCSQKRVWASPPLSSEEAEQLAASISTELHQLGSSHRLLKPFLCCDGRRVAIRARELVSIELSRATVAPVGADGPVPA